MSLLARRFACFDEFACWAERAGFVVKCLRGLRARFERERAKVNREEFEVSLEVARGDYARWDGLVCALEALKGELKEEVL